VDDPEGYTPGLQSELRAIDAKIDSWLYAGAEQFTADPGFSVHFWSSRSMKIHAGRFCSWRRFSGPPIWPSASEKSCIRAIIRTGAERQRSSAAVCGSPQLSGVDPGRVEVATSRACVSNSSSRTATASCVGQVLRSRCRMTWSDFYLLCFLVGFSLSVLFVPGWCGPPPSAIQDAPALSWRASRGSQRFSRRAKGGTHIPGSMLRRRWLSWRGSVERAICSRGIRTC